MRFVRLAVITAVLVAISAPVAFAQESGQRRQEQTQQDVDADIARQRRLNREFQRNELPLPELPNAGPCPFVKVLYDAARRVEFASEAQSASNVEWSSEIQGVSARCSYQEDEPIVVELVTTFAVGRGPQATQTTKTLPYWVAVTVRNNAVLAKEYYSVTAELSLPGERTLVTDRVQRIVIPRASPQISGANFEVLVGFDVTPEMAQFNRQGARFLINADGTQAETVSASTQ